MPTIEIRPFRRSDRDQVTQLVNRHAAAVMPGAGASVSTVLSQLEREPGEFIVDPWVAERVALVGEQSGAVVAAALLLRYRDDPDVGPAYRNAGEIRWLLFAPMAPADNPYWPDGHAAAQLLVEECLRRFDRWRVADRFADGSLPVDGVYGVPAQWPHIERLYLRNGFVAPTEPELLFLADLGRAAGSAAPRPELRITRLVGMNGTRFSAQLGERVVGHLEVEALATGERHPRPDGLADIGNLFVAEPDRRTGVGSRLLLEAADWLRLGHVDRWLGYAEPGQTDVIGFLRHHGFRELTRTRKAWSVPAG